MEVPAFSHLVGFFERCRGKKTLTEKTYLLLKPMNGIEARDELNISDEEENKSSESTSGSSKAYYVGCSFSLAAAIINASNLVTSQLLDDIIQVFQLSFGVFIWIFVLVLCYLLYSRKPPQLVDKSNIGYMIVFVVSELLYITFTFLAATHVALGTLNALLVLSFVVVTLCVSLLKALWERKVCHKPVIALDIITVILMYIGVIFLVQPEEMFDGIDYFTSENQTYTSLCNSNRFANITTGNTTAENITDAYKSSSWLGYLYAILAGLCNTLEVVSGKKLLKDNHIQDILFWMSLSGSVICLIIVLCTQGFIFPQNNFCFILLMLNAISGGLFDCLYFIGMRYISSLDVAIISGCVLPLLFVFQFTFLRTISPAPTNVVAIVASVLVLITVVGKPVIQGIFIHMGYM